MGWIALSDAAADVYDRCGLAASDDRAPLAGASDDDLLPCGTLMIETRLPEAGCPRSLLYFDRAGDWPFHISVQSIPGGGLVLVINQGGSVLHQAINACDAGRMDILRLTYCWDAPGRRGRVTLEQSDQDQFLVRQITAPRPMRVGDARGLFRTGPHRFVSPNVVFMALSVRTEPVGPTPSLSPDTPIATPDGFRPIRALRRGDLVVDADGRTVPVLFNIRRTVPARGLFRPLRMRTPYFGLQRDIVVAPSQRVVLGGSEVEYLFGAEAVLVPACHLVGGHSVKPVACGPLTGYHQLVLPAHEPLNAAGTTVESLFVGRLRRKPQLLDASALAGVDRSRLPEHGSPSFPVLRAFDARILAERRVA